MDTVKLGEGFFTDLENDMPYFKANALGEAGSGKSFTCARIAAGLHGYTKSDKPVVIFDTEDSSKHLRQLFKKASIEVLVKKSRSLKDLSETMRWCSDGNAAVLLIDSITHVWENYLDAYMTKKNRTRLQFQDWGVLKPLWKKTFSDPLVNSQCHIIFTGRQGFTYDYQENNGVRELVKTGIKMKAESETAYEPDLLIHMTQDQVLDGDSVQIVRRGTILKDRTDLIDGKSFINPTFNDFKPVIDFLFQDVKPRVEVDKGNDAILIEDEDDHREYNHRRKVMFERIDAILKKHAGGTKKEDKEKLYELKQRAFFGETSDSAILEMTLEQLESGLAILKDELEPLSDEQGSLTLSDTKVA